MRLLSAATLGTAGPLSRCLLSAMASGGGNGRAMLEMANWAVVGDVLNERKPASRIVQCLRAASKTTHLVNPRDATGTLHKSLREVGAPIDVVDLVINSRDGLAVVGDMAELGVRHVYIQPGASSDAIVEACARAEPPIAVHHGCVMMEGPPLWGFDFEH